MNYICPIFRFATQTFNGGCKRKTNTDKRWTAAVNPFISLLHPPSLWCEWCVKVDHTTGVYVPYSFRTVVWVKCTKVLWDGTYGHYKGSTFFSVILNKDPEFWSGQGSNPRPPALQTSALPTEPTRRRLLTKRGISYNPTDLVSSYCISESNALTQLVSLGAFHLVKISGISGSAVNRTRFARRFVPLENSQKKWKT